MATTSVMETADVLALMIALSWNETNFWTSSGSTDAMSFTWRFTSDGITTSPYTEMNAMSAGMNGRKP